MVLRVYLVPAIGTGVDGDMRRPKYVSDPAQVTKRGPAMDYGLEPVFLAVADVTPAQHAAIVANTDVTACPANLDTTIGGALAAVQAALEARNIPAEWIAAGMTYRTVLRQLSKLFDFRQRFHGMFGRLIVVLDDTVGSLPAQTRTNIRDVAATYGFDTTGISGSTTIRAALAQIIVQVPVGKLGGVL